MFLDNHTEYSITPERKIVCGCGKVYKDVRSFKQHCVDCNGSNPVVVKNTLYAKPLFEGSLPLFFQ